MKLLAFELATEACSVALWVDGDVRERFEIAPRRHAELALPWAEAVLADAGIAKSQLDAIAVGRGPGAFTGVRLAIAIAQGIALALDRPIVPVSTLAALALRANARDVLAAIDARMGEVYVGAFRCEGGDARLVDHERVAKPDGVVLPDGTWIGSGTGFGAVDGVLPRTLGDRLQAFDATALPHAADVARLAVHAFERGEAVAPERAEPAYLRDNVALTLVEQQAARAARQP
ncbi:tRNA (adenosine(37)-N6)-threonylcarbamoyltransferase complex dimerization subunit type 1 TsaB [Lysobacter helvus]|uniref:tRNA threonylcarbamoyladenosine biosynthesis protein TsaB n=2 Tax=Lysobacteraceae TaxID=32033 RepID=A0ABM7Q2W3_9GAMM|nr:MULTISPECIES: tRNA (adenosine(37)-N6)-threonylcarbamoyltransferase complex dimerization subunit type 1 TsaB [Lysobacter]BCT91603.1 tRNA (adenosine(37)-N6)-threonylcarbamoyltransferase complex dimerization subunit type 1 TsaB [Lysobacter caseinilyticus]BCT94756.1 tRNA (adenosine(37)-N6)-threonylcarbamoyltransferase complex dimerization subunit type 1 TsaB [Lysobacter helvus]